MTMSCLLGSPIKPGDRLIKPSEFIDRVPPKCVLWLRNRRSDSVWYDESGKGNHGTIYGPAWVPKSGLGPGLSFDGVDDYVNLGNPASLQITDELTVEFWANLSSVQASAQFSVPIGKDHSGTEGVALQVDHITGPPHFWHVGNGAGLYSLSLGSRVLIDSIWHHFVLTKSLISGMANYMDSHLVSGDPTYTLPIVWAAGDWNVGRLSNIPTRITTMVTDEVLIHHRVLFQAEISKRYQMTRGRYGV